MVFCNGFLCHVEFLDSSSRLQWEFGIYSSIDKGCVIVSSWFGLFSLRALGVEFFDYVWAREDLQLGDGY